ncbi:MAG: Uma2 family endonuclease [Hymenobacteraceae bacterium]|nr:Uma2 family endonuclease [Hymenobacteraceae bacterium]
MIAPTAAPVIIATDPIQLRGDVATNLTEDEFFALCQQNPTLRIERLPDQTIVIMAPCWTEAGFQSGEAFLQLAVWNKRTRRGKTYDSSAGFTLLDRSVRSPDAAWLSHERIATLTVEQRQKFWQVCPEFLIEVQSPSDSLPALREKMIAWVANGTRLAFLLSPPTETAWVYRADGSVDQLKSFDQTLSGEDVLPGFTLELAELRG